MHMGAMGATFTIAPLLLHHWCHVSLYDFACSDVTK